MDLIKKVKHLTGKGVHLEVDLPQKYHLAGSALQYHLTLRSEKNVTVRGVTAEISCGPAAPGTMGWGSGPSVRAAEPVRELLVEAEKPCHLSGSIGLPDDAAPTVNDPLDPRYWTLRVNADVPYGMDPSMIVGFVVGPASQFRWKTEEPISVNIPGKIRSVTAEGTCTVVQSNECTPEEIRSLLRQEIPAALSDLLTDQERFLQLEREPSSHYFELAGALREVLTPRLRASDEIPLDSVVELTVDAFHIEPQNKTQFADDGSTPSET